MNIFSGSTDGNGLAAALTNPTVLSKRKGRIQQDYPVYYDYRSWLDAEEAFLVLSRRNTAALCDHDDLMARIIAAKFEQHPRLYDAVKAHGGVSFLEKCSHITYAKSQRFQSWEGYGRESRFIRNLIRGYEMAQIAAR